MNTIDLVVAVWIALWALLGAARGMTEQVISLLGLAAGAAIGSRAAPHLLPGGRESLWLPLAALVGAVLGAILVQAVLLRLAAPLRRVVAHGPLRPVDAGGGLVVGGALGLALAWLIAAVVLYQPGDAAAGLRDQVQRSSILSEALDVMPPDEVLGVLARIDPFPVIPLPAAALPPPDPSVAAGPASRLAKDRVMELTGRACGLVKQGSGWVVSRDLVATNAHVIAGQHDTRLTTPDGHVLPAQPVYVDAHDDVALLRVNGLDRAPLVLGDAPDAPESVVMMGYPEGGPLRALAATASSPRTVLAPDAYGRGTVPRTVIVTRGNLGPGSSGGPILDSRGRVVAMIFGGTPGGDAGAAVPPAAIRRGLASPLRPVSPGPCAG